MGPCRNLIGTLRNLIRTASDPHRSSMELYGNFIRIPWNLTDTSEALYRTLWELYRNFYGTAYEPHRNFMEPDQNLIRISWNLIGTLEEPYGTLSGPYRNLMELYEINGPSNVKAFMFAFDNQVKFLSAWIDKIKLKCLTIV